MPPGGVHLAAGILGLSACRQPAIKEAIRCASAKYAPLLASGEALKAIAVGFITGSVLPDADIMLCAFIGVIHPDATEKDFRLLHRTFSHSIVVVTVATLALHYTFCNVDRLPAKFQSGVCTVAKKLGLGEGNTNQKDSERAGQFFSVMAVSSAVGCILHSLMDLFYVTKLMIFWPDMRPYGYPFLFPIELLQSRDKKALILGDFACDAIFWYIPLVYLYQRHALHPVKLSVARSLVLIYAIGITFFTQESWMADSVSIEGFTRSVYTPGIFLAVFLLVSPIYLTEAVFMLVEPSTNLLKPKLDDHVLVT